MISFSEIQIFLKRCCIISDLITKPDLHPCNTNRSAFINQRYACKHTHYLLFVSGYGKTVSHVVIGLKTAKGTKQLKLDPSIYESIQKEKVETGDVIYIEANSGAVKVIHLSLLFV